MQSDTRGHGFVEIRPDNGGVRIVAGVDAVQVGPDGRASFWRDKPSGVQALVGSLYELEIGADATLVPRSRAKSGWV